MNLDKIKQSKTFQVNNAVILAAGFGSRMMPATKDIPKPLIKIHGKRIIETLLDALIDAEIKDITIVRGYKREKFDCLLEKYPQLKFVDNSEYDSTNNISSIMKVLDCLDNTYICESDLYIKNPKIIKQQHECNNILGKYVTNTRDWCYKIANNKIVEYKKGNTNCYQYAGISVWDTKTCQKLKKDYDNVYNNVKNGKQYFWEFIPLVLYENKYDVYLNECTASDVLEIDTFDELCKLDESYKFIAK